MGEDHEVFRGEDALAEAQPGDDVIATGDTVREGIDRAVRPRYPSAQVIVCLVLNRWGKRRREKADEKWVGALEVDVDVNAHDRTKLNKLGLC